ncbi:ThuA domain-containing protein [Flavobacterium psychrotrophum]|uniref:ThuA domain-containing protein n=1 Tax=Flavobacterium psychrotrophum TaxID=2294119 RepID=UPI000E3181CA|nr:ThuA domain-containing protein [Flavobacterium psychrotrophum]
MKYLILLFFAGLSIGFSQTKKKPDFNVVGFYTGINDRAHVSFVHEANKWLAKMAQEHNFTYDSTNNWDNLNAKFLAKYQVVLFLDTRPEKLEQRQAFQKYMEHGGGFIGFHFAAFAMNDTDYPQNWDWYHNTFLGSGQYVSNTWKPTSAILKVAQQHPAVKSLPKTFASAPNEWYRWEKDLKSNADIKILVSIDPSSFPLGTGPKQHEIWHEGYYPVVWTNTKYRMLYVNMGHNDIDYDGGTNKELSLTFNNSTQSQLILNALLWLGGY